MAKTISETRMPTLIGKAITVVRDGKEKFRGVLKSFWLYPPTTLAGYTDDLVVFWEAGKAEGVRLLKTDEVEEVK